MEAKIAELEQRLAAAEAVIAALVDIIRCELPDAYETWKSDIEVKP